MSTLRTDKRRRGTSVRLLLLCSLVLLMGVARAQNFTVEVSGIDVRRGGNLIVLMFAREGFPIRHEHALLSKTVPISSEQMHLTFSAQLASHAALAFKVVHDQDANNIVTKNWTGVWPAEGLGFSNDARMRATGPPGFDDAKLSTAQILRGVQRRLTYP